MLTFWCIQNLSCIQKSIRWWDESNWWKSSLWISANGSSEQQNMRLRFMKLIMHPSSWLLDTNSSPLIFWQQFVSGNLFVDISGEDDMTIFVVIVLVLVWVFDFVWVVGHFEFFIVYIIFDLIWKLGFIFYPKFIWMLFVFLF